MANPLDPAFGEQGLVKTRFDDAARKGRASVMALAVMKDGGIVAAGMFGNDRRSDLAIARYLPDGTPDDSFAPLGRKVVPFGQPKDSVSAVTFLDDGSLIVVGERRLGPGPITTTKYRPDGTPDETFGEGGSVVTRFKSRGPMPSAVAIQPDGKIVVAGELAVNGHGRAMLVRLLPDGQLDQAFGKGGRATTPLRSVLDSVEGVAVERNGKIVLSGSFSRVGQRRFGLMRYTADGQLDESFGTGGTVTTRLGRGAGSGVAFAVTTQEDERIVAAGRQMHPDRVAIVRYRRTGALDVTFGYWGTVAIPFSRLGCQANAVMVQPDGKILVAGVAVLMASPPFPSPIGFRPPVTGFVLARCRANGWLDATFGKGGKVSTGFRAKWDVARRLTLQREGKLLAAGDFLLGRRHRGGGFAISRYRV